MDYVICLGNGPTNDEDECRLLATLTSLRQKFGYNFSSEDDPIAREIWTSPEHEVSSMSLNEKLIGIALVCKERGLAGKVLSRGDHPDFCVDLDIQSMQFIG